MFSFTWKVESLFNILLWQASTVDLEKLIQIPVLISLRMRHIRQIKNLFEA